MFKSLLLIASFIAPLVASTAFGDDCKTICMRNGERLFEKIQPPTNTWWAATVYNANLPILEMLRGKDGETTVTFKKAEQVAEVTLILNKSGEVHLIWFSNEEGMIIDGIKVKDGQWLPIELEGSKGADSIKAP